MEGYLTVARQESWEQVIEKSRFIGVIYPVSSPEEAERRLEETRALYPNARHYVYAWRIYEGKLEKASDDGEPQGTGGRPVLDSLQHRKLWNALIVVVRYFGGILLGTGGLSRAYGGTARRLLEQAQIKELAPYRLMEVVGAYSWYEPLKYQFRQFSWTIDQEEFMENVRLQVYIPFEDGDRFSHWLEEFTNREVSCSEIKVVLRV